MNLEYTPKFNVEYINQTILNTPQPQASSTVERKGVPSYRFSSGKSDVNKFKDDIKKKTKELLDDVPTRDTDTMSHKLNSSRLSSSSSLGILSLENMEDFQDYLNNVTKNTSLANDMQSPEININVNEKLQMQRILAQKALERADAKANTGGLPSYLLKPSDTPGKNNMTSITMPRNESTINLSDLEKSLPKISDISEKLSFEAKEISARSSSFGTKYNTNSDADVIDLTGQSPMRDNMSVANDFSSKCQSIYGKIRQSDISIAEMCDRSSRMGIHTQPLGTLPLPEIETVNISSGSENSWCNGTQDSLMVKLQNELFTPAELAGDKLLEDELSWRKENDIIPVDSYTTAKKAAGENGYLELSCFSGYIGDEDLSLKSNKDGKISFGEFFKRRTEDMDNLDLKASPEKKYAPIPLINLTSSICKFDESLDAPRNKCPLREDTQVILPASAEFSRMSTDSIMSMTRIAEVLAQMDIGETPSRVMDVLMKKSAPKTTNLRKIHTSNNLSENPSITSSNSSTLKNTQLAKLTDSSKTITQESSVDMSAKENSKFVDISPQTKKSMESVLKDTTNILEQHAFEQKNLQTGVIKSVTSDGDWTDAKPNTSEHNRTLSSITESPSYSCSELDFSEDDVPDSADNTLHKHTENWLEIDQELQPRKLYTNIPHKAAISVSSLTNHWLLVKVHIRDTKNLTNIARIELFNEEGLLKSQAKEQLEFKITSLITGTLELVFRIEMTDMVTKAQKQIDHRLVFESAKPEIQLSTDKLDFGMNCEGSIKKMNITVYNNGSADLPLTFIISQKYEWIYRFTTEIDNDKADDKDSEVITMKTTVIPASGSIKLFIDMRCPNLAELNCSTNHMDLQGLLQVYTSEPFKLLKAIDLTGCIGLTKIQFKFASSPLVLLSGQTKAIPVRNSGKVIMELTPKIVDETNSPINTYFTAGESSIILKPGQIGNVNVSFNCKEKIVGSMKRILRLECHRGPAFVFPIEGITEDKDCLTVTKSPLLGKSPRASPVATRLSKDRRSVEVKSPSDRPNTRNSQTGRSSTNSSDSGTLSYLQGGKLPIESTRTELIWGCVKPGKTISQEFILRNRCSQRVRLQATINGTGFKFIKDQTESGTTLSLMLHSLESRPITVNFSPNTKGSAAAKLLFLPIENDTIHSKRQMVTNKKQLISLYGYGGYCNLDIQKVAKDPTGKMWLSFGRLDYRDNLQQTLILRNTGTLAAFACLSVGCKVLYPFMDSSVKITPTEVVIPPNKEVEVCITFTPRQEDFKYIQTSNAIHVSEIASINVMSGPEPTRGRIRRLFNKMSHQGILPQMTNEFLIPKLSATFTQEHMPLDLLNCKESPGAMKELLQDLITREISLTIEHDPDKSGLASVLAGDDTCMFHSLCNETAQMTLDASYGQFETQTQRRASGGFCTVEPTKLMLTPPMKTEDTVLVSSRHSRPMPFEISIPNGGVQVSPSVGVVPPGETTVLTISCTKTQPKPVQFFKVMIYVENEVMEIEVKIHFVQARRS